jgi:hypothetical protein
MERQESQKRKERKEKKAEMICGSQRHTRQGYQRENLLNHFDARQ